MIEKVATLREIEEWWSLMDVVKANDAIDAVRDAERALHERERARMKKP